MIRQQLVDVAGGRRVALLGQRAQAGCEALASLQFIGEHLGWRKFAGLIIGFFGISIVIIGKYGPSLGLNGGLDPLDLGLTLIGLFSIATGVFYQKKFCDQSRLLPGTLMQYIAGALATAVFALLLGEAWVIDWTTGFVLALGWQVFGLSIGAVLLAVALIDTPMIYLACRWSPEEGSLK